MTGPGDEMAACAASRGHLRASHADREQVIGTLMAAFVQGGLAKEELDVRVGPAFAARSRRSFTVKPLRSKRRRASSLASVYSRVIACSRAASSTVS